MKPKGKAFGVEFKATILEGDGPKIVRLVGTFFFRVQDNMGFVDGSEVGREVMEAFFFEDETVGKKPHYNLTRSWKLERDSKREFLTRSKLRL
jgi:hypothetical protein